MSFPGLSRPTRGAGLALLAVAVVAAVVGGVVLATGDGDGDGDGTQQAAGGSSSDMPGTSDSTDTPATSESADSSAGSSSKAEDGASSDNGDGATSSGSSTPSDDSTDDGSDDSKHSDGDGHGGHSDRVPVRVYNNSMIKDLASEAADDFRDGGWRVKKVSNYSGGVVPETTAYYRKGTTEKAAAMSVAGEFGIRAKPRFDGIKDAHDGLIVIVAKDYESSDKKDD